MREFRVAIPARYASERLPGKPLLALVGRPMLQHVWERARQSSAVEVVVATDDERIADAADAFGADVCMTSSQHRSGTDRIAEVADLRDWPDDAVVVNLQGDEPLMPPVLLDECAALLDDPASDIGTLASPLTSTRDRGDPNIVKVVTDGDGRALYFSRLPIPFCRSAETEALAAAASLQHHGIYAYRCGVLRQLVRTPAAAIEQCERLEQLRALYLGMSIRVGRPTQRPGPGVDTMSDLERVERELSGSN